SAATQSAAKRAGFAAAQELSLVGQILPVALHTPSPAAGRGATRQRRAGTRRKHSVSAISTGLQHASFPPIAPHPGSSSASSPPRPPSPAAAEKAENGAAAAALAAQLERQGDLDGALAAYRRADAYGEPAAATNLGVLLEQRGDLDGAVTAYRRAEERGDPN